MARTMTFVGISLAAYVAGGISFWLASPGKDNRTAAQSPEVREKAAVHEAVQPREFLIEGMTCQGCVDHLTSAIAKIPGVEPAKVSLQDKKAVVVAKESQVPTAQILAAVGEAGYQGQLAPVGKGTPTATPDASKQPMCTTDKSMNMQPIGIVHSPYKDGTWGT